MADVMISYARADVEKASALAADIRNAGLSVWRDDALTPGANFGPEIARQIEEAACVVVLFSKVAQASEWVLGEAIFARPKLIPVVIERDLALIPPYSAMNVLFLVDWEESPPGPGFPKLLQSIRDLVSARAAALPSPPAAARFRQFHHRCLGRIVREELSGREVPGVDPPLMREAEAFLREPQWHERLELSVAPVLKKASSPEFTFLTQPLGSVRWDAPYADITDELQSILLPQNSARLARLGAELKNHEEDLRRSLAEDRTLDQQVRSQLEAELSGVMAQNGAFHELRELVQALQAEVRNPHYSRCFLVAGSPGAGKSHLVASLLHSRSGDNNSSDFLLTVEWDGQTPLEQAILDTFEKACGQVWPSLKVLLPFLQRAWTGARLVVILDDLERQILRGSGLAEELVFRILRGTELPGLLWLITLNPSHYDSVSAQSREWTQLGWPGKKQIGGWLDLDALNRDSLIGARILRQHAGAGGVTSLTLDFLDEIETDNTIKRNLSSPFLAWVLLDLAEKGDIALERLVTLSFAQFIESYWGQRMERIRVPETARALLEQAVWLTAGFVTEGAGFAPPYNALQRHLLASSATGEWGFDTPEKAAGTLKALADENLIAVSYDRSAGSIQRAELRFTGFWQFQIARRIAASKPVVERDAAGSISILEKWVNSQKTPYFSEGVLEFLLLAIVRDVSNDAALDDFSRALWRWPLDGHGLPAAAPWLAATWASRPVQAELVSWLFDQGDLSPKRRTLFALAHFCADALPEVLTVPERLRILQPHFQSLQEFQLESYYFYVAERLLPQAPGETELRQAMLCFAGCEVLGLAERLAEITVDEVVERMRHLEESIPFLQRFLKADWPAAAREEREDNLALRRSDEDGPHLSFYREWLIRKYLRHIVGRHGVAAYDYLDASDWYHAERAGIEAPNSFYMVREANFALAHWYRTRHIQQDRDNYVSLVKELVESGVHAKRTTAYYLMLHSVRTEGNRNVTIEPVFYPYLRDLAADPSLHLPAGLFQANLR